MHNDKSHLLYPGYYQRVLAELQRLSSKVKPGCLGSLGAGNGAAKNLLRKVEASMPELLIADGPEAVSEIFNYVPSSIAPLLLGQKPKSLEAAVRLLALNLDWYIKPPARLLRFEWIAIPIAAAVMVFSTFNIFSAFAGLTAFSPVALLISCLAIIVVWFSFHGDFRRAVWIKTLQRHFHARQQLYDEETHKEDPINQLLSRQ